MPELMIGSRRAAAPRSWRAAVIAVAMLGVAIVVAWFIYRRSVAYEMPGGEVRGEISQAQAGPSAPPALVFGTSSLAWTGGIPVLRVVGDAHAIGAAHGRLLAPWLSAAVGAASPSIEATVGTGGWFGNSTHGMRLAWRWRFVDDGFLDPDRRMIAGMTRGAEASGVSLAFEDLVRGQAVLDVGEPSPRTAEPDDHSLARSLTIVVRPASPARPAAPAPPAGAPARPDAGPVWIGRAFGLPGLDDGGDAATPVVTIAHPEGAISWASVGWPGGLGVVTGVNAYGVAVMVNPVRTADVRVTRTARPVAHLARAVLEGAKTLDEAVKLIEATPTLGAAVIALADGAGTWLIVERTPTKAIVERSPRAPVLGDVLTTNALAGDPKNDRARRVLATMSRLERAGKLVRAPLPDVGALAGVLRDGRTPDDAVRPAGHRGVIDDGRAAHVAILAPATLELWVADPRAGGRMRGFDLRYELRREGERPAPPPDIAANPAEEPGGRAWPEGQTSTLARARSHLRAARAALRGGDPVRAAESLARARVLAPALPEALELEAAIAQARGDHARARAALQTWLDGGADDPRGEERARALLAR